MLEGYSLHEQIGQGEYGKVYRATQKQTGQIVAVKVTENHKFNETPKLLELSMQEIEVLQKVAHCQYIVKFIELVRTPSHYYFVYEYCSGGPLDKLLGLQGHFTEQKSLKILYQLIQAFRALREHQIVHRDLKPSNILIHQGVYKLADFGFCKPIKNDVTATMLGSPIYMAPEVLRGLPYSSKADIWSLGAVLYELMIGRCPFEEKSIAKLITAQDETDWVIPPQFHFTRQTQNLLRSMLIKDPNARCNWEYLFAVPLNSEGEFTGPLEVYDAQKLTLTQATLPSPLLAVPSVTLGSALPSASEASKAAVAPATIPNILQFVVDERCKVQFICQTANLVVELQLNERAPLAAYWLLNQASLRGKALIDAMKNYATISSDELREWPSLQKLLSNLKQAADLKYFQNNFEYQRLVETIAKEMESVSQGAAEFRLLLDPAEVEHCAVQSYVKQVRSTSCLAFLDLKSDKDKHIVLHCVQVLDSLQVDKFMAGNIDPTLDNYLEIRAMTKKQLCDRFEQLII